MGSRRLYPHSYLGGYVQAIIKLQNVFYLPSEELRFYCVVCFFNHFCFIVGFFFFLIQQSRDFWRLL